MCHHKCLQALDNLGATSIARDWTAAFLYQQTMSVKFGETFSTPRNVPGGSPQGSILGNFLFCATTNEFAELEDRNGYADDISISISSEEGPLDLEEARPEIGAVCSTPMARS